METSLHYLNILVTTRCPLACRHCCFGCSPQGDLISGDVTMTLDEIYHCIDQALTLSGSLRAIGLSGGEPFLLGHQLVDICTFAANRGLYTGCVTSAYWAINQETALKRLRPLIAAGLQVLAISVDTFHADSVSVARVRHAVSAARDLGIKEIGLQTVISRSSVPLQELLAGWGDLLEGIKIKELACLPIGNAARLPEEELLTKPGIPHNPCPSPTLVIRPDGEGYFCCSAGAIVPALKLGNIQDTPLSTLWRRFLQRGLHRILIQSGPAAFIPAIQRHGASGRLKPAYVNVCHLCYHVLTDPVLLEAVNEQVAEWEIDRLQGWLERLSSPAEHLARESVA